MPLTQKETKTICRAITMLTMEHHIFTKDDIKETAKELFEMLEKSDDAKRNNAKRAREWNKRNPERHNELNKKSYAKRVAKK